MDKEGAVLGMEIGGRIVAVPSEAQGVVECPAVGEAVAEGEAYGRLQEGLVGSPAAPLDRGHGKRGVESDHGQPAGAFEEQQPCPNGGSYVVVVGDEAHTGHAG